MRRRQVSLPVEARSCHRTIYYRLRVISGSTGIRVREQQDVGDDNDGRRINNIDIGYRDPYTSGYSRELAGWGNVEDGLGG